jgi:hypothetical protein
MYYPSSDQIRKKIKLITKVGEDIPTEYISQLNKLGINLSDMIVHNTKTTRMIIDVRGKERQGHREYFCETINPVDIKVQ